MATEYPVTEFTRALRQASESYLLKGAAPYDDEIVQKGYLNIYLAKFIKKHYPTNDSLTKALNNLDEIVLRAIVVFFDEREEWAEPYRKEWEDQNKTKMSDPTLATSSQRSYRLITLFEHTLNNALEWVDPENRYRPKQSLQMLEAERSVLRLHLGRFLSAHYQYLYEQIGSQNFPIILPRLDSKAQLIIMIGVIHSNLRGTLVFSFQKGSEKVKFKATYNREMRNIFNYRLIECNCAVYTALKIIEDVSVAVSYSLAQLTPQQN